MPALLIEASEIEDWSRTNDVSAVSIADGALTSSSS